MLLMRRWLPLVALVGFVLTVCGLGVAMQLANRAACERRIDDRVVAIRVWSQQAKSAAAIAGDPLQSERTRRIRRREAVVLRGAVSDERARVSPELGGSLDCSEAFPAPWPWS